MSGTWTFGSLFISQFHRRFGRYPTEQELNENEQLWLNYLAEQEKPVPYSTARVVRDYNGVPCGHPLRFAPSAGQVVSEYLVGE